MIPQTPLELFDAMGLVALAAVGLVYLSLWWRGR